MKILVLVPPSKFAKNVPRDLVYGCWCKGKRIGGIKFPPLTSVLVATVLREDGNEVEFLDAAAEGLSLDVLMERSKGYELCLMLTSTMTINEDAEILKALKANHNKLISAVFGAHPTFMPKYTLVRPSIDIAIMGESEFAARDLARTIRENRDWTQCRGIAYRKKDNAEVIINPPYPFIEDLNVLPFPDRRMLPKNIDYFNPVVKRIPYTTIYTTRGCPAKCTFCSSPPFYGNTIRFRSSDNVYQELEIIKEMGYKEVFFRDEFFPVKKERTFSLCEKMISNKLDLTWICSARVGSVDKETMQIMKRAGCHMIRFGVESGVQEILNNIKKGIRIEKTIETFKWTHEVGMETHAHMMIGMPGETFESVDKSIEFAKRIDPTVVTFGICTPYPGTELFDQITEQHPEIGDGSQSDLQKLHTEGFFNEYFSELTGEQLSKMTKKAYRKFYARPSYILKRLAMIRSLDELRRSVLAGTQVFSFISGNGN